MPDPADPITELAELAAQLHEMFMAFQAAGFTENQALEVVIALAVHGIGG